MFESKVVAGIIGIAILIFGVYVFLDIDAASNLQIRLNTAEQLDFSDLSTNVRMSVCNPTFMPTSFDMISAELFYKSTRIGTFTVFGDTILPGSNDVIGRLNIHGENMLEVMLDAMPGSSTSQTFNENDLSIIIKFEKSILGSTPFSYEQSYRGAEFTAFWQGKSSEWSCGDSGPVDFFAQISSQVEQQGKIFTDAGEKTIEGASEWMP